MFSKETVRNFPNNSRFYILLSSITASILVACWLRTQIASDQLLYIRIQQVYGFLSLAFLYTALVISPLSKILKNWSGMKFWLFSRRAIGVSAFYFASLHFLVALFGPIGGLNGVGLLPEHFKWALIFGGLALFVLLLMALTSFDKVVKFMTYRKWKWLHRFVYGASILIILHVWMIGTHLAYDWVRLSLFIPIAVFLGLESWRITGDFAKRFPEFQGKDYFITIFISIWAVTSVALLCLPAIVSNYHSKHADHSQAEEGEHGHEK